MIHRSIDGGSGVDTSKVPSELGLIGFSNQESVQFGNALPVHVSHDFAPDSAVLDDDNLVSLPRRRSGIDVAREPNKHLAFG